MLGPEREGDVFQMLAEADMDSFCELIDLWVLEYAEQFAAKT